MPDAALLEVRHLVTEFRTARGPLRVVDDISFSLGAGETLGLVGESGCGKTVTALSILRLVPDPPGRVIAGQILFRGQDVLAIDESSMRQIRGNQISMVFQEPMTALNPVFPIGEQIAEAIRLHQKTNRKQAREKTIAMLRQVGIPSPETQFRSFPHQLSGGLRQRVMLAMALACAPRLLLADEPTAALDAIHQAQVLFLLQEAQQQIGLAILLITHDLSLVAERCQRVVVLFAGQVVESAPVAELFQAPRHPYTAELLRASLSLSCASLENVPARLSGALRNSIELPHRCRFVDRCPRAKEDCRRTEPLLVESAAGHQHRCLHPLPDTTTEE